MAASSLSYFLKSLNARADKETRIGIPVFFNVTITKDNKSYKMIESEPIEVLNRQVNTLVRTEQPDIVKVELLTESGKWIDGNVCDLRPKADENSKGYRGLGEAEVNAIVERRFEEKVKNEEYKELKEIIKDLAEENDSLLGRISELETEKEELEDEIQELTESLEKKKQIKYYAGMLGDLLESIGIRRERLGKPLAELMGVDDMEKQDKLPGHEDRSGIVEERREAEQEPSRQEVENGLARKEVIALISQYLENVENQLLGEIFTIFSAIESDTTLAKEIIEFIQKRREFAA